MEPGAITVEVGELPDTPLLLQATEVLRRWKLKKTEVLFPAAVKNLGASYYGWAEVTAVTSTGKLDGWSTHFNDDDIFLDNEGCDVEVSENVCFIVVAGVKGKSWGKLYLNPIHMPLFSRFLPPSSGDPQQDRRLAAILHVFDSILAGARPKYLAELAVTEKELLAARATRLLAVRKRKNSRSS